MSLAPGTRLGAYEITAPIGAGGMGEVYRGRDTKLDRDVAIKVLPETFASDPERIARFQREAKTLASLNHPHIGAIYGLEESNGIKALVLELVEGPTLADRIVQGPIPLEEALTIAKQIAEALEAAHEHGIIHRDLKPANIKLRSDGTVKVLDFGLAKAVEGSSVRPDLSASPTITSPAMTLGGVILGTAAYMSPEQATGKPVDRRSDIWAFGCVVYELLTGARAFDGDSVSDTIALVLRADPDWTMLPAEVPQTLRIYLERCVEKRPQDRFQDVGDVRLALSGAFDARVPATVPPKGRSTLTLAATASVLMALGALAGWIGRQPQQQRPAPTRRFVVTASPALLARANINRDFAVAPDGRHLAYFATLGGKRQIYLRSLGTVEAQPLRDAERWYEPFFSPDGQWIGVNDETDYTLRKIAITGGPPIPIAQIGKEITGATWGADGSIVFSTIDPDSGLWRVSADGGTPIPLTKPDTSHGENLHAWPEFLPGGRVVVFAVRTVTGSKIVALDVASGEQKVLLPSGTAPRYSSSGHLLYGVDDAIFAVPFDAASLALTGQPVAIADGVNVKPNGSMDFAVSQDGTLAYIPGSDTSGRRRLLWIDRNGKVEPLGAPPRRYVSARLSPDGARVVLDARDNPAQVAIWDLRRSVMTPLSKDSELDLMPIWTRDGSRIVMTSVHSGVRDVVMRAADGTGTTHELTSGPLEKMIDDVSPDGSTLLFTEASANGGFDIKMLRLDEKKSVPLLQTKWWERNAAFSSDGSLIAYQSDESGGQEIWVRPFPDVNTARERVSTDGGVHPVWAGRELLYVTPTNRMMSATVSTTPTLRASTPKLVMQLPEYHFGLFSRPYDITPDGKRFLMIEKSSESDSVVVVLNWFEELKRLVPVN
jgi:serine/threonine-protein kinase